MFWERPEHFDLDQIFNCGQAFRFTPVAGGYRGVVKGHQIELRTTPTQVEARGADSSFIEDQLSDYLDLATDYGDIIEEILAIAPRFRPVIEAGSGIRILRQDPFETLVTFIISANNNIHRIRASVEGLSEAYGLPATGGGYAFPEPEVLAAVDPVKLRALGLGYRDRYVVETARRVVTMGSDFHRLETLATPALEKELRAFSGVGPKVADCILLFGYHRTDVFPVDTWIRKAIGRYFDGGETIIETFGDLAGYLQQYLFYYMRENRLE